MPNEKVEKAAQLAERFRDPKDLKRQANPNLKEMTAALDGLRAMGAEGVPGLVDLLKPDAEGGDVHARRAAGSGRRRERSDGAAVIGGRRGGLASGRAARGSGHLASAAV